VLTNPDLEDLGKGCLAQYRVLQKELVVPKLTKVLPNLDFIVYEALTEVYLGDSLETIFYYAFSIVYHFKKFLFILNYLGF
jgi:hypothetical protein